MALSEFELIKQYFAQQQQNRSDVVLGIGDDAAIVTVKPNQELVLTMDSVVSGVHFLPSWKAADIAHKALAVNLSDLAAMGAIPAWATLSLVMPDATDTWLDGFCQGFYDLANRYQVQLIGGDVSRGPLVITIQLHGMVPKGQAVRRDGAKPGDLIYVTGCLGESGLALSLGDDVKDINVIKRLKQPEPRVNEGLALRQIASSMIDISDGLAADLSHILEQSGVGATLYENAIPIAASLKQHLPEEKAWQLALFHGEDYELCFTVPPQKKAQVDEVMSDFACGAKEIGIIEQQTGLRCQTQERQIQPLEMTGYQHFSRK